MDIGWEDVVVYAYTFGVVITGIFIDRTVAASGEFAVLGIGALVVLVWLVYYRYAVDPRLEKLRETDVTNDDENPTPVPTIEKERLAVHGRTRSGVTLARRPPR